MRNHKKDSQIYTNTQLEELAKSILSKLRRIDQKSGGVQEEFLSMVTKIAEAKEKIDSGREDSWPKEILDIRSSPCWACEASQVLFFSRLNNLYCFRQLCTGT